MQSKPHLQDACNFRIAVFHIHAWFNPHARQSLIAVYLRCRLPSTVTLPNPYSLSAYSSHSGCSCFTSESFLPPHPAVGNSLHGNIQRPEQGWG